MDLAKPGSGGRNCQPAGGGWSANRNLREMWSRVDFYCKDAGMVVHWLSNSSPQAVTGGS